MPEEPAADWAIRRGMLHHVDVDQALAPLHVPDDVTDVLMLIHHDGAVIGQAWLEPAGEIAVDAQHTAIAATVGTYLRRRRLRRVIEAAVGRPDPTPRRHTVAVVVCTRDRPDMLPGCLAHLRRLQRPDVELLVVDNVPGTEATARICRDAGVRHVVEWQPGQSAARNRGIAETTAELVAFTDDDVLVDPTWLDHIDRPFEDPLTMIATGYIGPHELDAPAQVLFERLGGFKRRPDTFLLDPDKFPITGLAEMGAGANMVIRRELFRRIGGFDVGFGPGSPARTADDKDIFRRALSAGYRMHYDPARKVWHRHRRDMAALHRLLRDWGTGEFSWGPHGAATDGDLRGLEVPAWWIRHWLGDAARAALRRPHTPPLWTIGMGLRGAVDAVRAVPTILTTGDRTTIQMPSDQADITDVSVRAEAPKVTVAIASYNRRDRLRRVLERLDRQTMPRDRYDVVVVLDGSTDGSTEMVRATQTGYSLRLVEQANGGLASARNRGAREATHPVVLFLDDDIEPRPSLVAAHANAQATSDRDTMVMGYFPPVPRTHGWIERETRAWWLEHFRRKGERDHRFSALDVVDGNSSMPVRLLERVGWFDEDFRGGRRQDYELGIRLIAHRAGLAYEPRAIGDHHPELTVAKVIGNGLDEGVHDAMIAAKHPQAASQLLFAAHQASPRTAAVRRLASAGRLAAATRYLQEYEARGQRRHWRLLIGMMWWGGYLNAVHDGLEAAGRLDLWHGRFKERTPVPVHLGSHGRLEIEDPGQADLVVHLRGEPIGRVRAVQPNEIWAWDDVVERVLKHVLSATAAEIPALQ